MALISEAKIQHTTCIKEAEANHAHTLAEAENCCSTAIREVESWGALQAHSIQQSHAKDIQHLEAEAIEEEERECLTFLAACSTALRVSPSEVHGVMVTPFHLLLGNATVSTLLSIPPGVSPLNRNLPCRLLLPLHQWDLGPCLSPSSDTTHLTRWGLCPHLRPPPKQPLRNPHFKAEGGNAPP